MDLGGRWNMLICPACGSEKNLVIDKRGGGRKKSCNAIRRRRECCACGCRFTSYEIVDEDYFTLLDILEDREDGRRKKSNVDILSDV